MHYTPWVIPTPEVVLPLVEPVVPPLLGSLRYGITRADAIEPPGPDREPAFWAHAARRHALADLASTTHDGWSVVPKVPNCGIHVRVGLHRARVLRAFAGSVPPPGPNAERQMAFQQNEAGQQELALSPDGLPSLNLLIDWTVVDGEPIVHLSLPRRPWKIKSTAKLYWREALTGDVDADLDNLTFAGDTGEESLVTLEIDPTEVETG